MSSRSIFLLLGLLLLPAGSPHVAGYEPPEDLYRYLATVRRIIDGRTISADIDLGFGVWLHKTEIRLKDVVPPEMKGETKEEGLAALQYLQETLSDQERILVRTFYDPSGEYDGWLGVVSIWDEETASWLSVNDMIIEAGHGK